MERISRPIVAPIARALTDAPLVSTAGGSGPASGDGLLLENGTDFLLLESGDFLLTEA